MQEPSFLTITSAAASKLHELQRREGMRYVRVTWSMVQEKGKSEPRFQRQMGLDDRVGPDDVIMESAGIRIVMDKRTAWMHEKSAEALDWVVGKNGSGEFTFRKAEGT